jgi:Ca2+-transporting ATPase
MGRIGKALQAIEPEPSPLQRETRYAVIVFAAIGAALSVLVTLIYAVVRGDWLNGVLAGITLAMANLPEEFPVVLTVFLALGAWRISKSGVLTRRAPAIETLGAAQVLCVDKTGTLTQNRMEVRRLWTPAGAVDAQQAQDEASVDLIVQSALASERDPFDPMEQAFHRLAQARAPARVASSAGWTLTRSYPLSPDQLSVARAWRTDAGQEAVAAKGAPEAIADLAALAPQERAAMHTAVDAMTRDGLRVLGVASAERAATESSAWPSSQRGLGLRFAGLVGLADPVRPGVAAAIAECYRAGIRTVMITGDHPGTAQAIAREIGLANPEGVTTGADIDAMSVPGLRERVAGVNVFARVMPEHKLRLVEAFKANGAVVAMTGDGVNDAPALRAAHIGVAMGGRGSDVAREAAALVLLHDDFSSLVAAVRRGRRIYDNIRKAMCYIVAVHVPIAGMSLLPLVFGWPLLFYPVHIVFLEFVIDPACSIAFEAEAADRDAMRRPPRPAGSRLFDRWLIALAIGQGVAALAAVALLYAVALARGVDESLTRTMGFAAIVLSNLALILGERSRRADVREMLRPNPALWWVVAGACVALVLSIYVTPVASVFRFSPLGISEWLASALPAAFVLAVTLAMGFMHSRARR